MLVGGCGQGWRSYATAAESGVAAQTFVRDCRVLLSALTKTGDECHETCGDAKALRAVRRGIGTGRMAGNGAPSRCIPGKGLRGK